MIDHTRRLVTAALAALALACAGAAGPAGAEENPASAADRRWAAWQFQGENDALAAFSGSDEHYTNGVRFNWLRNPLARDNPEWTAAFGEWWCARTKLCRIQAPPDVAYGHGIGQNMYTPEDITDPALIVTDRPYAGYLYYSTLVLLRNDTARLPEEWRKNRPVQNYFDLQIGFVGPESGAEWVQKRVHELIDDDRPEGWDHQLGLEPTIELIYLWRRKVGGEHFDLIPHWSAGLGNVMIFGAAGGTARFGFNLADFPEIVMVPTVSPAALNVSKWEAYVFAGAEGRGVARNIFLDGNTFRDSHSVKREDWVYDLKAGFAVRWKRWRFSYTFTRRSDEFTPNFDDDGRHDYGSVSLGWTAWPPGAG
jgi:hypothetical protein